MTDSELELHISSLAVLIEKAMAEGDTAMARSWMEARTAAIKSRTPPEQVAALETRLGLAPCQFTVMGEQARAAAGASQ